MMGEKEKRGNRKHKLQESTISCIGWGGRWGLLGLLWAFLLLGLGATLAQATPFAYITNRFDDTVSVIDTATNTVVATVPVGTSPVGVAVNQTGTWVYVANRDSNNVSVINTATNAVVATIPVGSSPYGVAVNSVGTRVYVANSVSNNVSVIDTTTNTVVATVPVVGTPLGVSVNTDGTRVYVTHRLTYVVSVIDTATNIVVATPGSAVLALWGGVTVNPKGTFIYVAGDGLTVMSTATYDIVAVIGGVGGYFRGVAVNPAGTQVYVANESHNAVYVINAVTNTIVATVPVGTSPYGVSINPAGTRVYVANQGSNDVSVIDTTTNTVVATVPVGVDPYAFGQFIGPVASSPPTLALSLTGCNPCRVGDRLTVQAHVTNSATTPTPVEVKVGVYSPSGNPFNLLGKHLEVILPPGLDTKPPVTILDTILPPGLPPGLWTFEGALLEPELGTTTSRDAESFEILP